MRKACIFTLLVFTAMAIYALYQPPADTVHFNGLQFKGGRP